SVDKIQWDPTIAVPLVNTRVTIHDFIKQNSTAFIEIDQDNLIHIVYRDELASLKASDFIKIPLQHYDGSFGLLQFHINELNNTGTTEVDFTTIFNFGVDDTEVDSIFMKACGVMTQLTSDLQHDVKVDISIPEIVRNGQSLKFTFDLPYDGSGSATAQQNKDLKNSFFDLTKSGDQTHSQLLAKFKITVTKVGNNPTSVDDKLSFVTDFIYNEYDVLFGLVKSSDISPSDIDTLTFDIFKSVDSGSQYLQFRIGDPRFKVIISNSYGIPLIANISEFSTYSRSDGKLTLTGYPDPLVVPTPTKQQIGQTLVDSFELNKSNSNIADVISNIPQYLAYGYGAQVNPPGTTERNFITYNSELKVAVDVDIPLHGSADGFALNHEVSLDSTFNGLEDIEELDEVTLRLFLQNDFPVDVQLQFYFQDENKDMIDSLFEVDTYLLRSAVVDADGKTIESTDYTLDITMNKAQFDKIRESKFGLLTAKLNTYKGATPQPEVKFFSDYGLSVKLGIQAKGVFNIKTK
ncbi:MAG: hypothetical protein ACI8SE_001865, partial [Bacteroidia bacterium]